MHQMHLALTETVLQSPCCIVHHSAQQRQVRTRRQALLPKERDSVGAFVEDISEGVLIAICQEGVREGL